MEETKRENQDQLQSIIIQNCRLKHPTQVLPDSPWFLRISKNQKVSSILLQILHKSNKRPTRFAKNMSKLILSQKEEEVNFQSSKASYIVQNIDIRKAIQIVQKRYQDGNTVVSIKAEKLQSNQGPITAVFEYKGKTHILDQGDQDTFEINLSDSIEISLQVDNQQKASRVVLFEGAMQDIHYLSAVEKQEFSTKVKEERSGFTAIFVLRLRLSKRDRENILETHLIESERNIARQSQSNKIYDQLLEVLGVAESEDGYVSMMKNSKAERGSGGFCDNCVLIQGFGQ